MKSYYISKTREAESSILSIHRDNTRYDFSLLHSSITEVNALKDNEYGSPHSHDVYHAVLYTKGKNQVIYKNRRVDITPGTLLLVSPGEDHDFYPCNKGEMEYSEITFEYVCGDSVLKIPFTSLMSEITGKDQNSLPSLISLDNDQVLRWMKLFYAYGDLQKDYRKSSFEIHLKLAEIWQMITGLNRDREKEKLPQQTAEIIRNSLTEKLNLDDLSRRLNVSKTYINREFKRVWNTTPMEFHRNLRLEKAADLLRSGEESLKEVADTFSFYDEFHFSRSFQSLYGIPPGEFRKRTRTQERKDV
ncbi:MULTISPECIES: AraC family transcriptional regulator [unclassified Oceanispirochaeta]|uniref:AraC family transcriptional regulator n=1 Tax=unclassified Oceanispirochaeta TaxID=2635722 RepID=UPI000E092350|nr:MULTISPECIES: AraC family transcriptional regulator [unclassified Oceanispirochaeta]MBF9016801.1 helix-turn-helix transcriptional regulator [Oceanispirochaeta sp. M2]NPD72071.1 helix-turn-helix transcriptional regulator [Oceanispirochaeta sp. M1]RDG32514.1 AraC family transcriptional regulator [Oceanispirochaeta sp. M1]